VLVLIWFMHATILVQLKSDWGDYPLRNGEDVGEGRVEELLRMIMGRQPVMDEVKVRVMGGGVG